MDLTGFTSPPKRVVLGDIGQNGASPISPMANLKLLTKVATGHLPQNDLCPKQGSSEEDFDCFKTSRRSRSLSFICQKFLSTYKLQQKPGQFVTISLGNLAMELGIEKRRVYDIINVVSSLQMAVKVCKDKYLWYGDHKLVRHLSQLKAFALLNKFDHQVKAFVQKHPQLSLSAFSDKEQIENGALKITSGNQTVFEENRIGVLCQKFIMLFLVAEENCPLNLIVISKLILTKDIQDKTGMRRLYDVANVLEALGLVRKYSQHGFRKPTFVYSGPHVEALPNLEPEVVFREPSVPNCDAFCESNSESSTDAVQRFSKLETLLQPSPKSDLEPPAKKRLLFPREMEEKKMRLASMTGSIPPIERPPVTFIKAPASSFRFSSNRLTASLPQCKAVQVVPKSEAPKKGFVLHKLDSMKLVKRIAVSNIQNGAIYRAVVSNNNTVQFVKL